MRLLPIRIIHHAPIALSDGTVLSAMIWLPKDAESEPVPAILEYLPYRKRDMTAERDATNMPYVAGRGYACVRVDMRGTGDSEGLILGEYLKQEQDDALEVLQWIAAQQWCTGSCGMIGISWGGFNSLQVAARRPKELKAIVSIASTDDRYNGDIHFMGGCVLTENFTWAASMFAINSCPPDPAVVGDQWRDLWLQRLESGGFFAKEWHENQRRNDFWKHGSICEDYSSIEAATYLVSGWQDPYTNTVFRMLESLKCPKKGLVGPWGHKYPNFGKPGPQIGFLQETVRWWDKWLKGIDDTGIMDEPQLRCYLQDPAPPAAHDKFRPGHWVAETKWNDEKALTRRMGLAPGRLTEETSSGFEKIEICSPQTLGFAGGRWLIFGVEGEGPSDQRLEAGGSLIFDTEPMRDSLDLLGAAILNVRIASDKPNALLAATLSEVLPNGAATRISYGLLNLTHRHNHEDLQALEPGKFYDVKLKLNHFGQRLGVGSRLRLALSSTYFPIVWPSPEVTTLTIDTGSSFINLPVRIDNSEDSKLKPFGPRDHGSLEKTQLRPANHNNYVKQDWDTGRTELVVDWDDGKWEIDETGWRFGWTTPMVIGIHPSDPLSAEVYQGFDRVFERDDIKISFKGWTRMTATSTDWIMTARIDAWEGEKAVLDEIMSSRFLAITRRQCNDCTTSFQLDSVIPANCIAPSIEQVKLPYLHCVIKETLRMSQETEDDGVVLPADTTLALWNPQVHRDPNVWSKTANQFDPDCWGDKRTSMEPGSYVPFSYGPRARNCLGQGLAMLPMSLALAMLFRRFDLSFELGFEMEFSPSLTSCAKNGLRVCVARRF